MNAARTDQIAQVALEIYEHWPERLTKGLRSGQTTADIACDLLRELRAIQTGQPVKKMAEPERIVPEYRNPARGERTRIVCETVKGLPESFTTRELRDALPVDVFFGPQFLSNVLCYMRKQGLIIRVGYLQYRKDSTKWQGRKAS